MGRVSATTYRGKRLVRRPRFELGRDSQGGQPRGRAVYTEEHGGRGTGHVFGAFKPHTGEAFTATYRRRTKVNYLDFLNKIDAWLGAASTQVIAVADNLNIHHAHEVLLFMLAHPRWEFAFIPVKAAYLNLIEPWWKTLRSLALAGKCFQDWEDVEKAIAEATAYWNSHRHPYRWGHRRRHRARRQPGIATYHQLAG